MFHQVLYPEFIKIEEIFNDFQKIEIKIGTVLSAEKVENSEKLLKLSVDFGESAPRQVVSGIAKTYQ